ncbi:hypothetical protein BGY98DRAFT_980043 [Russula aff. rugulosa BPL654]|nr:hypothetical protein BGY98DRAFT_980043 [Russula aff. rugulosa BPL654]
MASNYFDLGPDAPFHLWLSSFHDLPAAVLLYYDYLLTLPREIQFLWPPHNKQGWFTLSCLINRYIPMIGVFPIAMSVFIPVNLTLCIGIHTYREWLIVAVQIHVGILCLLRVYALYGRSHLILGLLLFLGMGLIITALTQHIFIIYQGAITIGS